MTINTQQNSAQDQLREKTARTFAEVFSAEPEQLYWAPGRVNLIGEHTDYNDGFVLPCAINYGTVIAASPRNDNKVVVIACDFDNARSEFELSLPIEKAGAEQFWSNYVRGTAQALMNKGHQLGGANLVIAGNVPQGAGLSSSASLEVVTGLALCHINNIDISNEELALAGQSSENDFVGSNTGIMDQMISACGQPGHAVLLDCRTLNTRTVSMPDNATVVIINSNVKRGLVDSEYNTRRQQCEDAAEAMGVPALRDADMNMLESHRDAMEPVTWRRARHIITENTRTLAAADALKTGDLEQMGRLMAESHVSMRDDFEITVPAIDTLVEIVGSVISNGGVRMTGGGFGGCIVALVPTADVDVVKAAVMEQYPAKTGLQPAIHICQASSGAAVLVDQPHDWPFSVRQEPFGKTPAGEEITRTTLINGHGMEVVLLNYGATIQAIRTPDRDGQLANIVLSCDNLEDYVKQDACLGAVAGRNANRIAHGRFSLNGEQHQLSGNLDGHHLHGGYVGFQRSVWKQSIRESRNSVSVTMTCHSPDGDEGYPGDLDAAVTYTLNSDNQLDISYRATTSKATIINLTQHSYFNLAGGGSCLDHVLRIQADHYLPTDSNIVPAGNVAEVGGTPFDFRDGKAIGKDIHSDDPQLTMSHGFDHNLCLSRNGELQDMGEVFEPGSGRVMRIQTDQPGVQLYTGNYLDGVPAPEGKTYSQYDGFCLETQAWPDAPNHPEFPSTELHPGKVYQHQTVLTFSHE